MWLLPTALAAAGPPARIVSATPSVTEMLFALGLGDRVVGVTTFCRYPPAAARIPKIGTYIQPNLEVVLSLRPDLVVIQENPARLKEKMESLRLKVLELRYRSVADVCESLGTLGRVAGVEERARALTASIRGELEAIRRRSAARPRRRILFVVGRTANAVEGLIVVGQGSYLNELMELAGGRNVFRGAPSSYPQVPLEEVLARDPEVIVDMGEMARTEGVAEEQKQRVVRLWERYATLTAVRRKAVHAVASDIFVVPGPRMVEAARAFERMLHPETAP